MSAAHPAPCDAAAIRAARPGTAKAGTGVLAATVLGSSLSYLDGSVVNVALPAMAQDLGAGAAGVQWIVNAYLLPLAALVLLGGALADRLGNKRVFMAGLVLFALASVGCLLAPGLEALIAARAAQGVGAALLVPASLAILGSSFSGDARGAAVGTWAAAGAAAGALGPVAGGWLVDSVGWRSIFALLLPIAAAAIVIGARSIPRDRPDAERPIDWSGAGLATAGLIALTFGLTQLSQGGGAVPAALTIGGLAILAAFLWVEHAKGDAAMMPLALFGTRVFAGATILTLVLYAALGGLLMLVPFMLIARGWSAMAAGAAMLPLSIVMGLGSRFVGRMTARTGARLPLTLGPAITALGFAWFARFPEGGIDYWRDVLPAMALIGIGMTLAVAPLTDTVLAAVDGKHQGAASGVNNATARVAGLLAIALIGLALSEGGRDVPLAAFHMVAITAAALAVAGALASCLLIRPDKA